MTTTTAPAQTWIAPGEQGFLVGETLYFRAIELGDADFPAAWRFSPFPITRQRAEKMLKEELAKQDTAAANYYVACRRDDDVPIGAVIINEADRRTATIKIRVDPTMGKMAGAMKAEMLRIIVPWLATEHNSMVISAVLDGPEPELVAAIEGIGMRPAVRLREAVWRDGARVDQWFFEFLHPFWRDRLGEPEANVAYNGEPPADVRTSRRVSIPHPMGRSAPKHAVLVSERLALRPTTPEDAPLISKLIRAETESTWGRGRWLISPLQIEHWVESDTSADPPGAIFLAIILRETGELVGEVELTDLDWFNRTAETGSMVYHPALRSQGIGSEAKHLLLEYAFDHLGLHMLKSFVWSFNTRSQAALRKQGYREAGRLHWRAQHSTGFAPNVVFDLLASEWRKRVGHPPASG